MSTAHRESLYDPIRGRLDAFLEKAAGRNSEGLRSGFFLLPDLLVLTVRSLIDADVALAIKLRIGLSLAYILWPFDFLPGSAFGVLGMVDDLVVGAYLLASVLQKNDRAHVERLWPGHSSTLDKLRHTAGTIEKYVVKWPVEKIRTLISRASS